MSLVSPSVEKKSPYAGGFSPFNMSFGKLMMWMFLLSDAFTFGAFLISYGTNRYFSHIWPDPNKVFQSAPGIEGGAPMVFVSFMTFVLILSSVTMVLAVHSGHYNDKKGVVKWLIWTVIGGLVFLACQAWEWTHLHHEGAWWGSFVGEGVTGDTVAHFFNMTKPEVIAKIAVFGSQATHDFFNYFFSITGFHGFHVFSGVILNIIILLNAANGVYERKGHYEMIEKVGLYWHFVDLVWVFVFTCFYLL